MRALIATAILLTTGGQALAAASNAVREWTVTQSQRGGAEARLALVIGNSAYDNAPLRNPANDARLIARTLHQVGFEVTEVIDADQTAMKVAISKFGKRLDMAGDNAVGLFYYAGHGIQVSGQNYLVPVGAPIQSEADVDIFGVSAQALPRQMEFASNRMNIVILDACRNNPFKRSFRSASNGLAQMRAPSGSLLAFSTAPGDVAADGSGVNSPYTLALTQHITTPNLELGTVFKRVAATLQDISKGRQVPWIQSSITGDFYFRGGLGGGNSDAGSANRRPEPRALGLERIGLRVRA